MPASLAQKLQLKPGQSLVSVNTPAGCREVLMQALSGNPLLSLEDRENAQALLLFVNNLEEAVRLAPTVMQNVATDGLLWLAYPKGSSKIKTDVNRDRLWEALAFTGWRPVRQVSIDDTWSAMRFRPSDRVGGKSR